MVARASIPLVLLLALPAAAEPLLERLPVSGHGDAIVVAPNDDTPAPLVVALHGNFDRAEWLCDVLAEMTAGEAWILCPRGVPRPDSPPGSPRWTFGSATSVKTEIAAGVKALRARYGSRVSADPVLLTGYSAGAFLASVLAASDPTTWPRVLLAEGGHTSWTPGRFSRFAKGGVAVGYGCGTKTCVKRSKRSCRELERRAVPCRVHEVGGMGHSYTRAFGASMAELYRWLVRVNHTLQEQGP